MKPVEIIESVLHDVMMEAPSCAANYLDLAAISKRVIHAFEDEGLAIAPTVNLDPACMIVHLNREVCRPAADNLKRCTICGFVVDTKFAAEKPQR